MAKATETLKLDTEDREAIRRIAKRRGVTKHALLVQQVKRLIAEERAARDADWFLHFTDGRRREVVCPELDEAIESIDGTVKDLGL